MKHTKTNIIKSLKEQLRNTRAIAKYYKQNGDEVSAKKYLAEAIGLQSAIFTITDKKYFDNTCEIFNIKEDK